MGQPCPVVSLSASIGTGTTTAKPRRRTVAFTTPRHYADRLSRLISVRQWTPISSPTIIIESTPLTTSNLLHYIRPLPSRDPTMTTPLLNSFSSIAFTSRAGITAFQAAMRETPAPPLSPLGDTFTVCALGKDAELLHEATTGFIANLCRPDGERRRVRILEPPVASPSGLVEFLGPGGGRKVLCPVPRVVGVEEPPVVPDFLSGLRGTGWDAVRVDAYQTSWVGPDDCLQRLLSRSDLDAVVFTSTAEVEGLFKGLRHFGLDWASFKEICGRGGKTGLLVAAHGPVTAAGAERLGLSVDVVSSSFGSFEGVVQALATAWGEVL